MTNVRLTGQASRYLAAKAGYLRDRNSRAAAAFLERMAEARSLVSRFPDDYALLEDGVVILSIRHGAQAEPPQADPDFDYEA